MSIAITMLEIMKVQKNVPSQYPPRPTKPFKISLASESVMISYKGQGKKYLIE